MNYSIVTTRRAKNDLIDIGLYIAEQLHSPKAAIDLLDYIEQHILSLEQMPKKFALVSDERLANLGIRKLPVKNYLIFYFIDEQTKTVTITRILYGRRDWAHLL